MGDEFRCFVGGLSWNTNESALKDEFRSYGVTETKVIEDRETGRSRGFGFVTFADKRSMDDAIAGMDGKEIDGRVVTVNAAQPRGGGGGGGGGGRYGDRGGDRGGGDRYGGGGGGGGGARGGPAGSGECFKCGQTGHWARDCPDGGGGGGGGYGSSRGGGGDRYGDRDGGDRYSGRSGGADRGSGGGRDRSGPYDRPSGGGGGGSDRY